MLYTKPTAWKHEAEWRARKVQYADSNGVAGSFFPIVRVIFGNRMPKDQQTEVLGALDLSKESVWEARPTQHRERYAIAWRFLGGREEALPV